MFQSFIQIRPILSALLRSKTAPLLVALQVALSLAILVNAMYIVNLRLSVAARSSGVAQEEDVFRVRVSSQKVDGHEAQLALYKRETQIIAAVPGVLSVARVNSFPLSKNGSNTDMSAKGKSGETTVPVAQYWSGESLVKTWGLTLIAGRDFETSEVVDLDPKVSDKVVKNVIVSKAVVTKLFPSFNNVSSAVGQQIYYGRGDAANAARIVGVVDCLQTPEALVGAEGEYAVLEPVNESYGTRSNYAVRSKAGQRDLVIKEVEAALRKAYPMPIRVRVSTMEKFRADRYRAEKGLAWMLLAVSGLLILITASGIVGMSSLWVAQRRKQIGVRRALGARRLDILTYFLAENWLITTTGICVGVLLGMGLNQILMAQFELPKLPMLYLAATPFVFWGLGWIAVYLPAWRAASISPATATRGV